jgi:hypothetical protein
LLLLFAVAGSLCSRGRNGGHADYGRISRYCHDGRGDYDAHRPTHPYANILAAIAYGRRHSHRYIIPGHDRSLALARYTYRDHSRAVVNSNPMPHSH